MSVMIGDGCWVLKKAFTSFGIIQVRIHSTSVFVPWFGSMTNSMFHSTPRPLSNVINHVAQDSRSDPLHWGNGGWGFGSTRGFVTWDDVVQIELWHLVHGPGSAGCLGLEDFHAPTFLAILPINDVRDLAASCQLELPTDLGLGKLLHHTPAFQHGLSIASDTTAVKLKLSNVFLNCFRTKWMYYTRIRITTVTDIFCCATHLHFGDLCVWFRFFGSDFCLGRHWETCNLVSPTPLPLTTCQ